MRKLSLKISDFFSQRYTLSFYLLSSLILSAILSLTAQSWNHPDEWYQTVEFANYLGFGQLTYSPEVIHHLRNLSWPFLLAGPMKLADLVAPHSYALMMFVIQFFSGVLNLVVILSLHRALELITPDLQITQKSKTILLMALTFTFFLVGDAIRPSQEHLSIIAFWASVYFIFGKQWFGAGLSTIAIFTFKYPAAFLSLGLFLVVLFWFIFKQIQFKNILFYGLGLILGIFLFGAVDWVIYGRPWESFWMYSLYNLGAGLSHKNFGEQSAFVYLQYFRGQWSTLFSLWILLLPFFFLGIKRTFKKLLIIIVPLILYLLAHLLIKHKEPRFMAVFDYAYVFFAGLGILSITFKENLKKIFFALFLIINIFLLGRELKGDLFRFHHTFLQAGSFSKTDFCATVTLKKPYAFYLNHLNEIPPMGYWPMNRKESLEEGLNKTLNWLEKTPQCQNNQPLMVQIHYWEAFWENQGCEIESSYFLGSSLTKTLSEKKLIDGVWGKCPNTILGNFKKSELKHVLVYQLLKLEPFPSWHTPGENLLAYQKEIETKNNWWIGSFPEW